MDAEQIQIKEKGSCLMRNISPFNRQPTLFAFLFSFLHFIVAYTHMNKTIHFLLNQYTCTYDQLCETEKLKEVGADKDCCD